MEHRKQQIRSALYKHYQETDHQKDFDNCKQIASIEHLKARVIREAIEIEKIGTFNKRDDALNFLAAWKTILSRNKNKTGNSF